MKNVLLLIHDDAGQEARLQVALDLTRLLGGHLSCVDVTYMPPLLGGSIYEDVYAVADLVTHESEREAENKSRITARLAHEDVPWTWNDTTGEPVACIERVSALADVIVVSRGVGSEPGFGARMASELVVRSGKPILAVPPDALGFAPDSVLVAWDGSTAASTALRAATPVLQHAGTVSIIEVGDGSIRAPAEEAASYLSRYGIHPCVDRVPDASGGAGRVLLDRLSNTTCDLLVMGGFGHRRWVESLFGGVTKAMLMRSPVPILLAH